MTKSVFIAGSTGSIGTQALAVCKMHNIEVESLSAGSNVDLLVSQAKKFNVKKIHINNENKYKELKEKLPGDAEIFVGEKGLIGLIKESKADTFLNGITGSAGLIPTVTAIEKKMKIALANKETIVCGGEYVMALAKNDNVDIMPVDSEHSAVFQSMLGNKHGQIKRIILTASGGPFFGKTDLKNIKIEDALNHPNWSMGKKITIDSATLMNKGLEVIEAHHLFGHKPVSVVVHRESIVHSMVEYDDNAIIAQLGSPDMTIPIQLALTYPDRLASSAKHVDFETMSKLTFYPPDTKTFVSLNLAYKALEIGGTMPCVLNCANEVAVDSFLNGKIEFYEIPKYVEKAMENMSVKQNYTLSELVECDKASREETKRLIDKK